MTISGQIERQSFDARQYVFAMRGAFHGFEQLGLGMLERDIKGMAVACLHSSV